MSANKINTISFNIDIAPKAHDMGRNLLRGAGLTSLNSITEGGVTFYRIKSLSDSLAKIVDGVDGNKGVWVKTNSGETNVYRGVFFIAAVNKGEQYTLSAWVKGTAGTTLHLEVFNSTGTARKNSDGTASTRYTGTGSFATINNDWRRVTFTFTVDDLNGGYVECNFFTNAVGEFTICEPKLERGDVATAFCLNEADLKGDKGDKGVSGADAVVYTIEAVGSSNNNSGTLTDDAKSIAVTLIGNLKLYKTAGSEKMEDTKPPQCWRLTIGGTNVDGTSVFSNSASNNIITYSYYNEYKIDDNGKRDVPGSATISVYKDITLSEQLASLVIPITLNPNAIVDVNTNLGNITSTTISMRGTIETIKQGQGQISLKVQDLQNGGIDTGKPHTSSQVDFTTLSSDNFYPVMIKFKNDDGVRHTVVIDRPLNGTYGSGKGYMTHPGDGFSFRLIFSDIANAWGSYEDGQLRIESISQYWTTPADTPICPKIAQYYPFSFIVAWLRGGSKYDITVDCTDAYISGIWPYMMQVASNPSWVPDAVRLANDTWTFAQINAQAGNPYNLLKKDGGGYYSDVTNDNLYRFGRLTAGHTFAIVGQPTDSKTWFIASWTITRVSGSKVYVDVSTYGILWQTQNPLGIRMKGVLGYIKTGASYAKSIWDSQSGFGTSESIDNTAVHANWVTPRPILVIGTESGTGRDRAVLESVNSCSEGSSVSFSSGTYFDVSPLYGTDGRMNVKPDMLATGIDIKSHKILITSDNVKVRNNKGEETTAVDAQGNLTAGSLTCKDKLSGTVMSIMNGFFSALKGKAGVSLGVDKKGYPCLMGTDPNGNVLWRLGQTYETADQDSKVTMEVVSMKAYGQINSYAIGEGVILTLNVTNNTNTAITINTSNMHMVLKSEYGTYRGNVDVATNISVGATAQVVLRGTEAIDISSSSSTYYTTPVGLSVTAVVVYQGDMRLTQDAEYQYHEGLWKDSDGNVQYILPLMPA